MIRLAFIVLAFASLAGCSREEPVVLNFDVQGMHCDGCADGIKSKLAKLPGVTACDASFEKGSATVTTTDPAVATRVVESITEMGYTVHAAAK